MELIENLHRERDLLLDKLKKINELIEAYTGESVVIPSPIIPPLDGGPNYPKNGTWKERIIYVLKKLNKPVLVADIVDSIVKYEPELAGTEKVLKTTIGQYCSIMGGDDLDVVKGYKNQYSLKNK